VTSPLARFNTAPRSSALATLREVCAASAWCERLVAGRPYASVEALLAASDAATEALTGPGLDEAMGGHPPIGRPAPGDPVSSHEQRGMAGASGALRAELARLNLAYQERFGHVFLICATGATGERMRDELSRRLAHTPEEERAVARAELGRINRLRLGLLAAELAGPLSAEAGVEPAASVTTHVLDTSVGRPARGVPVSLAARPAADAAWAVLGGSATDADGRCKDLPALPGGTRHARLVFDTGTYFAAAGDPAGAPTTTSAEAQQDAPALRDSGAFFPDVTVSFTVTPGEHHHVPLLLNPFGYSVYRGS
jgi:2-oxo-4-hydroxy-4-carboxy-5-ureidoimidazoline decarboxylase